MTMDTASVPADSTKSAQQKNSNYVAIIPVEYPRSRVYTNQNTEFMVEQYSTNSEYSSHCHEEFSQREDLSSGQGTLYSVSQRVPPASTSYSSLCTGDTTYTDQSNFPAQNEWDTQRVSLSEAKDSVSDGVSDKHIADSNTTASVQSSVNIASSSSDGYQGPVVPTCVYLPGHTAVILEVEDTPNTTSEQILQAIIGCDELNLNKQLAAQLFTLWMSSPLLELQLKPNQKPYEIRRMWKALIARYSHASYNRQQRDEASLSFQRNVFHPPENEDKIKDQKILELLYEEAKYNILQGRYPCEVSHYIMLGGIQARIELGPYNPQVHSTHYFREEQAKYLPVHVRKSPTWTWLPISSKNSAEVKLLEQFKRVPSSATNRKLIRKYLEFCWSLPFYGSGFFEGQIEQPVRGLFSLLTHQDIPVLVAINSKGLYVIDDLQCTVLLGLRYEEFSWEYARPSKEDNPFCLPCLFIQFMVVENGARVSKVLQVFSRQANFMDSLITCFSEQAKNKSTDEPDKTVDHQQLNSDNDTHSSSLTIGFNHSSNLPSLTNKLSKLTLATFDDEGRCIGQMGSWSLSY